MGKRKFITFVRKQKDKDFNEILRALMGITLGISKASDTRYHRVITDDKGNIYVILEFTKKQYLRFNEIVEGLYPGLCDFNI